MSLADCLKTVSLDHEDRTFLADLVKAHGEQGAVAKMAEHLDSELADVRKQLAGVGHAVDAPKEQAQPKADTSQAPAEIHDLQSDVQAMREQGVAFTAEEEADLKAGQETYDAVSAWERVMQVAKECVLK